MSNNQTTCKECFGTGRRLEMRPIRLWAKLELPKPCPECAGSGRKFPRVKAGGRCTDKVRPSALHFDQRRARGKVRTMWWIHRM